MICPKCHEEIEPVEETTSSISIVRDKDRRVKTWMEETRDPDGVLVSKRVDEYGYVGDVIDTIKQQVFDGEGTLRSEKTLKHFSDGRQPVVEKTEDEKIGMLEG